MFSDRNLDAPPPPSQFRRPWSPEIDFQPSSTSLAFQRLQEAHYGRGGQQGEPYSRETSPPRHISRREASEASVEALDLADYARTLRHRQAEDAYPPFPSQIRNQNYPAPSTYPSVIPGASSTDYLPISTPPLLSRGPTVSSNATMDTFTTIPRPLRRPFSLPPTPIPVPASHASSSRAYLNQGPYIVDANNSREIHAAAVASTEGIDISRFPKWSRGWYNPNPYSTSQPPGKARLEPHSDIYTSLPLTQFQSGRGMTQNMSIFDPKYVLDPHDVSPFNPYSSPSNHHSSAGHTSREVLPWSNDIIDRSGPTLDPMLKEERVRMLEREFGSKANEKGKHHNKGLVDEEGKSLVGTIDAKGHLVTVGPRRRMILRTSQVLLAAAACIPAIYAAIVIKATDPKNPPPPANKPAAFVLYVLSSITLLTLLYMYLLRPCCFVRSKSSSKHPLGDMPNMGMMVLPVGGGGKKDKKPKAGKKHKGKWGLPGAQDVQVNLIVDPAAFQPPDESESDSNEEDEEDMMPGDYNGLGQYDSRHQKNSERHKKRNRQRRRRGVFEGLAMEEQWRVARAWAKKVAAVDMAGLVLWSGAFVFIMIGKKCPSGGFNGWCNAYNVSIASACLLAMSFGIGTFFDVQDLYASKQSPRTRS